VVRVRLTGTGEEILNPELLRAVRGADPRSFAMVMATGIVSVALRQVGAQGLSAALLWVAVVAFAVLVVASAWRVVAFGQDVRDELRRPDRVFSYFAFPAAASVVAAGITATWIAAAVWAVVFTWMITSAGRRGGEPKDLGRSGFHGRSGGS
jgi:tellurite resistance protein TehA-like permease